MDLVVDGVNTGRVIHVEDVNKPLEQFFRRWCKENKKPRDQVTFLLGKKELTDDTCIEDLLPGGVVTRFNLTINHAAVEVDEMMDGLDIEAPVPEASATTEGEQERDFFPELIPQARKRAKRESTRASASAASAAPRRKRTLEEDDSDYVANKRASGSKFKKRKS